MLSFPSNLIVTGSIKPLSSLPQVFRPVELGPGGMRAAVGIGLALWCMASGILQACFGGACGGGGVCAAGVCGHFWALCIEWLAVVGCREVPVDAFGSLLGLGRLGGLCLASRARRVRASSSEIYRTGKLQ